VDAPARIESKMNCSSQYDGRHSASSQDMKSYEARQQCFMVQAVWIKWKRALLCCFLVLQSNNVTQRKIRGIGKETQEPTTM